MINFEKRIGRITASEIYNIIPGPRGGTKGRDTYLIGKVVEKILNESLDGFENDATVWGNEVEPLGKMAFLLHLGLTEEWVEFDPETRVWKGSDMVAYTPDMVGDTFTAQGKCPYSPVEHYKLYLLEDEKELKKHSPKYYWQTIAECVFEEKERCYFHSYSPRFVDAGLSLKVLEWVPSEEDRDLLLTSIAEAEEILNSFSTTEQPAPTLE